ncbi:MAG: uroporphyrinogen decarboxylase family protein, partial [SAR324 cluster bacterium]|nr:uroporphyrinogen decarboxylase family protein [SAR324 cluster bacterium]
SQLLANGTPEAVTEAIEHCLAQTGGRNHILNLNHGLLERTPFEQVMHFVNTAKTLGAAHSET